MIDCDYCGQPLDGTGCRWLCPRCGMKLNCCEGAPLPERDLDEPWL
jgi:tRNA(Ile2) C34 agmatinyltransferase TiaS